MVCRFNWGLNVRKKSERVLQLLENGKLLKEERDKARKITRGIEGFGSFSLRTQSGEGVKEESTPESYRKCNSLFVDDGKQEDDSKSESPTISWSGSDDSNMTGSFSSSSTLNSFKENMAPESVLREEMHEWNGKGESNPLLSGQIADSRIGSSLEEDHPFTDEPLTTVSLLSASDRVLQAC